MNYAKVTFEWDLWMFLDWVQEARKGSPKLSVIYSYHQVPLYPCNWVKLMRFVSKVHYRITNTNENHALLNSLRHSLLTEKSTLCTCSCHWTQSLADIDKSHKYLHRRVRKGNQLSWLEPFKREFQRRWFSKSQREQRGGKINIKSKTT